MSQSPKDVVKLQRYEDGWEAINRMIREDLSWSGRERNCFHVAVKDGRFVDISAASGVDYQDDGRAFGVLDVDRDGRPDLLLRNRTAPLVRVLQNTWPEPSQSLWLKLEGMNGNRDAIGARIEIHTSRGVHVKEVQAGNLFLSQSSRWIPMGLGSGTGGRARVTVRWPGGVRQDLGVLETGHRYTVREGGSPQAEPYSLSADLRPDGDASAQREKKPESEDDSPPRGDRAVATWLIEPVPAPEFSLVPLDAAGTAPASPVGPRSFRGKPLFLHFISTTCAVCLSEAPAMRRAEPSVEKAGAAVLHVIVNSAADGETVRSFARRLGFRAPIVQADERLLRAYNVLHRQIWNRRRDLAVPTTFLLDGAGSVVKVYRGATPPEELALDATRVPESVAARLRLSLPYPGRLHQRTFGRDLIALGNAYLEAGLEALARETFERSVTRDVSDVDSLFNYAVATARAGRLEDAKRAYRRVLEMAPQSDDARNNLGVLLARSGERREAERMFRSILERNPAHGEAPLNLANLLNREGRDEEAQRVLERAAAADPESALFRRHVGYAQFRAGRPDAAIESLRHALRLDPLDPDVHLDMAIVLFTLNRAEEAKRAAEAGLEVNPDHPRLLNALGMAQLRLGEHAAGVASLERAMRSAPTFDRPYLNLARFYEEEGDTGEARRVLERLLEAIPDHPAGRGEQNRGGAEDAETLREEEEDEEEE